MGHKLGFWKTTAVTLPNFWVMLDFDTIFENSSFSAQSPELKILDGSNNLWWIVSFYGFTGSLAIEVKVYRVIS